MQGSVLLVFILSSLFAGEESQLGKKEKGISVSCVCVWGGGGNIWSGMKIDSTPSTV